MSVLVAAWPDARGLRECLEALEPQRDPADEVVVVACFERPPEIELAAPWARWTRAAPGLLVPHLWGLGVGAARGDVIALTTAHFIPARDWIEVLRTSHVLRGEPAVGGPIEPPRGGPVVAWATFFVRYANYLGLETEQDVPDLAGDNASYKRAALAAHADFLRAGFWEHPLHRRFRAAGARLRFVPQMRVRLAESLGFLAFASQRFRHGRQFGSERVSGAGRALRLGRLLSSPLLPVILLARIVTRVARDGRLAGRFLWSLPVTLAFLSAWSLGEASGYIRPARAVMP